MGFPKLRNDGPAIAATFLGEFLNAILDEDQIPGTLDHWTVRLMSGCEGEKPGMTLH